MRRIGTFQVCDICDPEQKPILVKDLYVDKNGELGWILECNICNPICCGHFTKLSGLEYIGYGIVKGSIKLCN